MNDEDPGADYSRLLLTSAALGGGGAGVPVRNGLVAEYKFDECRNLLKYSQQFDNAAWSKTRCSITPNSVAAPDGTTTADTLIEDNTAAQSHALYGLPPVLSPSTIYTLSVYAKKGNRTWILSRVGVLDGSIPRVSFDLHNGVVGTQTNATGTITSVGSGWYRCVITFNSASGVSATSLSFTLGEADNDITFDGDSVTYPVGVYLWGAQLEAGSSATTYVPTTDKQTLMDYSKPRKNLLLPNQANGCGDGVETWFTKATAGDTVSASTTVAWQGTYSAKVICANAAASEGLYTEYIIPELKPSTSYAASAYVYGSAAGETIKIGLAEYAEDKTTLIGTTYANLTLSASWQRVAVTRTFGATGRAARIYVITQSKQACTMYVDGLQLEEGSTATAWEAPPNIGIVGSAIGNTTNDPTWTGEGAYFMTDDKNIIPAVTAKTLTIVYNSGQILPGSGPSYALMGATDTGTRVMLGSSTSLLDNEIICVRSADVNTACGWCDAGGSIAAGWHTITIVWNTNTYRILLDGVEKTVTTTATVLTNPCQFTRIGVFSETNSYFTGSISYISIYDRALTQAEIAKNYAYLKSYLKKNRGISLP